MVVRNELTSNTQTSTAMDGEAGNCFKLFRAGLARLNASFKPEDAQELYWSVSIGDAAIFFG